MIVYSYMSTSNSWYNEHYYNSVTITIIIILRYPPVIKRGSGKLPIYINDDFPSENNHSWGIFQPATFGFYQGYILDTCLNRIWISDHLSHLSLIYHYGFWIKFLLAPKTTAAYVSYVHFSIDHPLNSGYWKFGPPILWQVFDVSAYNGLFSGWIWFLEIQWILRFAYPGND